MLSKAMINKCKDNQDIVNGVLVICKDCGDIVTKEDSKECIVCDESLCNKCAEPYGLCYECFTQ